MVNLTRSNKHRLCMQARLISLTLSAVWLSSLSMIPHFPYAAALNSQSNGTNENCHLIVNASNYAHQSRSQVNQGDQCTTSHQNLASNKNRTSNVALVIPSFTAAAYSRSAFEFGPHSIGGFYAFYFKHKYENYKGSGVVSSDLDMLTAKVPLDSNLSDPQITSHLKSLLPNDQISLITDLDVHYNRIRGFDVLLLFHQEYVTQDEYNNLKNFVANGGTLVVFDGNVFMAEVKFNSTTDSVTLVSGHTWQYKGRFASLGPLERWASETSDWMGSNYYYTTPNVTFQNDPFGYRHHEEQAIVTNQKNISILMDYRAINKNPLYHQPLFPTDRPIFTVHPLVATYIKNFGKGKVIVLGIYGDFVVGNPAFLQFFDKVFMKYALGREMPMPLQ